MLNSQKTAEYLIDKFTRWPISTFKKFMGGNALLGGGSLPTFLGGIQWKKSPVSCILQMIMFEVFQALPGLISSDKNEGK